MPATPTLRNRPESPEDGFLLLAVIFMVALVLLSLAVAAPRIAASIQRDREIELVHRGEQYKRAIRLYYKKFGNYPTSIDQLESTNNLRFLRKRYLDPLTGKDDWRVIPLGQAHVCPLGFFGQPLGAAATLNGATSAAGLAAQSSTLGAGTDSGSGSGPGTTGTTGGTNCGTATGGLNGPAGSGPIGGSLAGGGTLGLGGGAQTSTTLGGGNTNTGGFGADSSTTLGGAPIQGVEPPIDKPSILAYKLKTKYKEWEFAYWPQEDQQQAGGGGSIGGGSLNGTSTGTNTPGSSNTGNSPFGGTNGNSPFGSNPGSGNFGGSGVNGSSGNSGQSNTTPQ
jgi:type II secretory pathway pseudopilin PulG